MNETRPTGTQAIERAIHLMKLVATRGTFGWGLTDLARRSRLEKATVHRILGCLESERLVARDQRSHRYLPGPMMVDLGLSVSGTQAFLNDGRAALERLAGRADGVALFYLRSGSEFVVAGRVERTVHRGMLNEIGFRRPLIMSAGGVAMLITLPRKEREAIVVHNLADLREMGITRLERFERMLARSLELGYSANLEDVVPGINSFSVHVSDREGHLLGAIAIAGDPTRFPAAQGRKFTELLTREAAQLGDRAQGAVCAPAAVMQ